MLRTPFKTYRLHKEIPSSSEEMDQEGITYEKLDDKVDQLAANMNKLIG